jgi:glycosyltransferase involved in cell wall biosynthesis
VTLSVVIAAWNGPALLKKCLNSLIAQADANCQVIVAANFFAEDLQNLAQTPATLTFLYFPDATVPELRAHGIQKASGDIIALLEDHCTLHEMWVRKVRKAHESSYSAIGGAVENSGGQRPLDWAIYLFDYGPFMLPEAPRVTSALTGFNVSYKRPALEAVKAVYRDGFFEVFTNQELQRHGYELFLAPSVIVYHSKNYSLKPALVENYHHGRLFAAQRTSTASSEERIYRAITALALPLLLPMRVAVRTIRKQRHIAHLITALPYLVMLMSAWGYGEFCGYLFRAGASARRWK